jgi:hypothetical protein
MEFEERYVIKFFTNKRMPGVEIISCLRNHFREDEVSRTQVGFWIEEVRRGRTDPRRIATAGIELYGGLPVVIAGELDADSYLCARQLFLSQILG